MQNEENILIEKLKQGNENAWRELIDNLKNKIYKTALSFIPSTDDAEDIVQEVFIEAHKNINNFRADSSISTWLYRITVNKSLNFIKKNKKIINSYFINNDENNKYLLSTDSKNPATILQQKETRRIIYATINQLPKKQSTVFIMHKINGYSYKEISEITNLSISSVESLIHRAKKSLQKKLVRYGE